MSQPIERPRTLFPAQTDRRDFLAATAASAAFLLGGSVAGQEHAPTNGKVSQPPATDRTTKERPAEDRPPTVTPPGDGRQDPTHFRRGLNLKFREPLPPESDRANEAFLAYLAANAQNSEVMFKMRERLHEFRQAAPRLFVSKCIDGRVHTSDPIGYPPTAVTYLRTEGTRVDLSGNNSIFWNRLHSVLVDAERNTPDSPALFLAMAHRAVLGSGCAAHDEDDDAALATVREQAEALRKRYDPRRLYTIHGITNTDDHSDRLIFPDGHELDAARAIRTLDTPAGPLRAATDVFQPDFLDYAIDDRETHLLVGARKPRKLVEGGDAPMFHELQTMVALESYLLNEIWHIIHNRARNNVVFQTRLFDYVVGEVRAIDGLSDELHAPLVYQLLWNIATTLHERQRLAALPDDRQDLELNHAESLVAYGEGFELGSRNSLVLVKPGRGYDVDAMAVAKKVITKNRHRRGNQDFPPLVHINVEVSGVMEDWSAFNDNVLSRLWTMVRTVHSVFETDCRVLTTYSYRTEKRFYPVRIEPDPTVAGADVRESFPADLDFGFTDRDFSRNDLKLREDAYTRSILAEVGG